MSINFLLCQGEDSFLHQLYLLKRNKLIVRTQFLEFCKHTFSKPQSVTLCTTMLLSIMTLPQRINKLGYKYNLFFSIIVSDNQVSSSSTASKKL